MRCAVASLVTVGVLLGCTCYDSSLLGPAGAGGDIVFVVAAYSLDFGDTPGADPLQIGHDLDMRCTCQGQGNSCLRAL